MPHTLNRGFPLISLFLLKSIKQLAIHLRSNSFEFIVEVNVANRKDFFEQLTSKIVEDLQVGVIPWEKPWFVNKAINAVTGKAYRGVNQLNLSLVSAEHNLNATDMRFLTFNQARERGWKVKRGSKAVAEVVFFSMIEKEASQHDSEQTKEGTAKFPLLKFSPVFHASQVEGIPEPEDLRGIEFEPNQLSEKIIQASNARIIQHSSEAFYSSMNDHIGMPAREKFRSLEGYYGTLLHELGHWTGHTSRLNRGMFNLFGSEEYAREELVAELASVFLCAETGIEYVKGNHTAYVQSWLKALRNDPLEIKRASAKAMQAVDYLLNLAGVDRD